MAELKTKPNEASVEEYLNSIAPEQKQVDCRQIYDWMKEIVGEDGIMWGTSIVGFGNYHYKYKSGREGDWFLTGFAARKQAITIYSMTYLDRMEEILNRLGKYKTGKGCLYIKKLEDVDTEVLKELIVACVERHR